MDIGGLGQAWRRLGMPFPQYAKQYLLPLAAGGAVTTVVMWLLVLPMVPDFLRIPLGLVIPIFFAAAGALLPTSLVDRRKQQIERSIHFYITRAGVLAKANLSTIEILRRLTDKQSFGALAEESERIVFLVQRWNMSISDACRAVAKRTPSAIYADFLERMAYALDSGEELSAFLESEQGVVMEDFATVYQGALYNIETLKSAFISLAMSVIFLVVFGIVSPILTGFKAEDFMIYALLFLGVIDSVFLMMMLSKAPVDPLWHAPTGKTPRERIIKRWAPLAAFASMCVFLGLFLAHVQLDIAIVASMTPPVAVGLLVRREEAAVRKRDDHYPAFVRALGSATSASGGVVRMTLKRLRHHNFGPLSSPVERLYRRLHLRIDDNGAWRSFAVETGSNLVSKFNAMFVEGARAGGEPEAIGRIISTNYVRILNLRKHRKQTAQSFRSTLFGFTAGMAFTLHVGTGVLAILVHLFEGVNGQSAGALLSFKIDNGVNFALLALLVQVAIIIHSLMGALMTQAVEGGSFLSGYVDFVILLWIAVATGLASDLLFKSYFPT